MSLAPEILATGGIITLIVHLFMAIGTYQEASSLKERKVRFLWPSGWALVTLLTGLIGLMCYWLIHHSALAEAHEKSSKSDPTPTSSPSSTQAPPAQEARPFILRQ